jgi:cell division protein FtsL
MSEFFDDRIKEIFGMFLCIILVLVMVFVGVFVCVSYMDQQAAITNLKTQIIELERESTRLKTEIEVRKSLGDSNFVKEIPPAVSEKQ